MAFNRLKNGLGKCPVYEIRGVRKQESPEDQEEEPMTGVALVGFCSGTHGSLNKCCIIFDCRSQLGSLKVEHCVLGVLEFDGSPQESPINGGLNKHCYVPYNQADEGAVNRPECSLNVTDLSSRWRERLESKTRSRTIHSYLNGEDVGSMFKIKPMQCPKLIENMHASA
ncbi:hypothetical protein CRG98_014143 [Punica granatum]|uniref:Uncharacterized protein n=1 Tax=Punica granatum TaxID=22663 RepID=A0A2I0KAC7_PUNGR|nr:hypothetical protein CRG98_014143 [Punica granatum]